MNLMRISIALVLSCFTAGRVDAQGSRPNAAGQNEERLKTGQRNEPTPVAVGQMTPREKVHSKLLNEMGTGQDLDEATKQGRDVHMVTEGTPVVSPDPVTVDKLVAEDVCKADAVVIGTVKNRKSQLTDNKRWVFSELQVEVLQSLKDNSQDPINSSELISVVTSGGSIRLNNQLVEAYGPEGPLSFSQSYLFFLKYIPQTESHRLSTRVYGISGDHIRVRSPSPERPYDGVSLVRMTSLIQVAATQCTLK